MKHNLKLQAWVDGELSEKEMRAVAREIAVNTDSSQLVAELSRTRAALTGNEPPLTVPETRDFYWSKIQREIQRQPTGSAPAPARANRWKRWLAPALGLGVVACTALLVRPAVPAAAVDEIASGGGMDAVTFHDQSTGMTVVWLEDPTDSTPPKDTVSQSGDAGDVETE